MEEILKTALHCDNKEKLKERLALLQREYNRTVQRLQRAERTEAVRNHVRSRIDEQNLHQKDPDSVRLPEPSEAKERRPFPVNQDPEENSSPAVRFSLPQDVFGPCASPRVTGGSSGSSWLSGTPQACSPSQQNGSPALAQGLRRSSAHRLRSRRSRLRWERRERTDSGVSDTETSEDGRDPSGDGERRRDGPTPLHFSAGSSPSEATPKPAVGCSGVADAEVVPENLPSPVHWEGHGSNSRGVRDLSPQLHSDASLLDSRTAPVLEPPEKNESSIVAAPRSPLDTAGTHSGLEAEASIPEPVSTTEESRRSDVSSPAPVPRPPGAGRRSSCTLIEGLLFPAEYYIRTTRRMSAAQSSVDLGAVIQGQLSRGRRGRGRRGRGSSQGAITASGSQTVTWKDIDGVGHDTPESESSLTSRSSPAASGAEPPSSNQVRGARRRGRGRRRACGQGWRRGLAHSVESPAAVGSTMLEPLGTDPVPTPDIDINSSTAERELYPIFCAKGQLTESSSPKVSCFPFSKKSSQSNGKERLRASNCSSTQAMNRQSLLLTCSPAPQRPHVLTLGETHLSLRFLLSHFDAKDFHLPDDEFGMLKQDKLRLPACGDLEAFAPPCSPYHTRQHASGTPSDNTRYRKKLCAVRSLPPADGPHCAQPEVEPSGHTPQTSGQTDLGSERDAQESLTPSLAPCEATRQGEEQHCDAVCLGRENRAECAGKAPSLDGERTGSAGASEGLRGGVGNGEEDSSPQRGAVVSALSPSVVNLSPTPTVQSQKSEAFALPSLGVTPAFPLHPITPVKDCCSPTPPLALSPTTHCIPRQGPVICCEPNGDTQPPSLSNTPGIDVLDPSQNPPGAAVKEADPRLTEAPAEGDWCVALARLSATKLSLTDSLSSSLCPSGSVSAQCRSPALSPPVECRNKHSSPLPQRAELADARSPKTACADSRPLLSTGGRVKRDGVDMPASGKVTPSVPPKHKEGECPPGPWAAPPALPLTGSGRPHHTDTEKGTATPCTGEDDFDRGVSPHKPEQDSLKAPSQGSTQHSGWPATPGPAALPSSSLKSEYGGKDLDSYFTDSAWSRGAGPSPESGHSSPGQDPAEGHLDTPPLSTHTVREGPSSRSLKLTHVLKAPGGRCLVDVCSVSGAEGWCVVTAEEWTVCVWGQSPSQHWSLLHTWTFTEHPVIALLSVPDAPGLLCVTLGKLEIREARALLCASAEGRLCQSVLCAGEVQAVLGVSGSRVACCSTSGSTQTTTVVTLTGEGRLEDSLSLVSPGQSVQALAAVDGQKNALVGSTGSSHLVVWNTRTGHLLRRFSLGEGLSGSVCLRGYSQSGVLFVLLQHQFLHDLNAQEGAPFSLIATNPVTARSVLIQHLTQPAQCAGRFADGDVLESVVVAVFQSGGLAVWDLRDGDGVARLARGPEEGCHVARWGSPSTLLAGHLNGDVSLYQYTPLGVS